MRFEYIMRFAGEKKMLKSTATVNVIGVLESFIWRESCLSGRPWQNRRVGYVVWQDALRKMLSIFWI